MRVVSNFSSNSSQKSKYHFFFPNKKVKLMFGNMSAGHFHIFWECFFFFYWVEVVTKIRSIISSELDFDFSVIYLGKLGTGLNKQEMAE